MFSCFNVSCSIAPKALVPFLVIPSKQSVSYHHQMHLMFPPKAPTPKRSTWSTHARKCVRNFFICRSSRAIRKRSPLNTWRRFSTKSRFCCGLQFVCHVSSSKYFRIPPLSYRSVRSHALLVIPSSFNPAAAWWWRSKGSSNTMDARPAYFVQSTPFSWHLHRSWFRPNRWNSSRLMIWSRWRKWCDPIGISCQAVFYCRWQTISQRDNLAWLCLSVVSGQWRWRHALSTGTVWCGTLDRKGNLYNRSTGAIAKPFLYLQYAADSSAWRPNETEQYHWRWTGPEILKNSLLAIQLSNYIFFK